MCGDEWCKHSSATGGFYACNRYVAPDQAADQPAGALGDAGLGLRAILGSMLGKIQVSDWAQCVLLSIHLSNPLNTCAWLEMFQGKRASRCSTG